jgi:Tol biopolymer transport system component
MPGQREVLKFALVAFVAPMACLRGERVLATRERAPVNTWIPFGTPAMVAGLRSVTDDVQDPSLGADELEIYFTSPTRGINDIWRSQRASPADPWGASSLVAELSSPEVDEDPELAPDGLSIYLSSDRQGESSVMQVWLARRPGRDQPWGAPQRVLGLGASSADVAPSVDTSGLMMIFASLRGTPDFHLFSASRPDPSAPWEQVDELVEINSAWQDRDPAVFNQGRGLIFTSRRTGQGRTADLFHVSRSDVSMPFVAAPEAITDLNTDTWEGDPWISANGQHLLFVSDRSGTSRIYEARR